MENVAEFDKYVFNDINLFNLVAITFRWKLIFHFSFKY